ncbi:MAG: UDP-glucose 4-epimerase GalE [Christensenellales bacterium]
MAVLVTGGTGFIGSHTAVVLLEAGFDVVIVDNLANSKPDVPQRIGRITGKTPAFHQVDLLDKAALEKVFEAHEFESVIHFAGLKAVGESVSQPLRYYHNNITGTLNLLETMQAHAVNRLVFSSSATVYGDSAAVPMREDALISATNPYGQTKVMIEIILRDACRADGRLSAALLRYFNPVGAHESGLIGEDPSGIPNNLVPYIAKVARGELEKLRVFGDDYDTPDGTGVRDYIHVMDLAKGHLAALEWTKNHTGADAFNLGTGSGSSVMEVVRAFEQANGIPIPLEMAPRRPGDIGTCYADVQKARDTLGWEAALSLGDMMRDAWRFARGQN